MRDLPVNVTHPLSFSVDFVSGTGSPVDGSLLTTRHLPPGTSGGSTVVQNAPSMLLEIEMFGRAVVEQRFERRRR